MASREEIIPGGLSVLRGFLDADRCMALTGEFADYYINNFPHPDGNIMASNTSRIPHAELRPNLRKVIDDLEIPLQSRFGVNYQTAFGVQPYHTDGTRAVVLHTRGNGQFDYNPVPTDFSVSKSIFLDAGDVVISNMPKLRHRGRNRAEIARYVGVFFLPLD